MDVIWTVVGVTIAGAVAKGIMPARRLVDAPKVVRVVKQSQGDPCQSRPLTAC